MNYLLKYSALKAFVLWCPFQAYGLNRNSVGKVRSCWRLSEPLILCLNLLVLPFVFLVGRGKERLSMPSPPMANSHNCNGLQMSSLHTFSLLYVFATETENERRERSRLYSYLPGALLLNMLRLKMSTITLPSFLLFFCLHSQKKTS